jgi:small-conductance mechanosensitive channel
MRRALARLRACFGGQAYLRALPDAQTGPGTCSNGQARTRTHRSPAAALLTLTVLLCAACSEPPQKEINRAQGAIDAARAAGADQYAAEAYKAATGALQQAHEAVEQRDYRLALSRALDANERALEAAKEAANGKARARSEVDNMLTMATASVQQLQTKLHAAEAARLPQLERSRKLRADAQRALQEARAAVKEGSYLTAMERLKDLPARIAAEIKVIDDAMVARATRGGRRRR